MFPLVRCLVLSPAKEADARLKYTNVAQLLKALAPYDGAIRVFIEGGLGPGEYEPPVLSDRQLAVGLGIDLASDDIPRGDVGNEPPKRRRCLVFTRSAETRPRGAIPDKPMSFYCVQVVGYDRLETGGVYALRGDPKEFEKLLTEHLAHDSLDSFDRRVIRVKLRATWLIDGDGIYRKRRIGKQADEDDEDDSDNLDDVESLT